MAGGIKNSHTMRGFAFYFIYLILFPRCRNILYVVGFLSFKIFPTFWELEKIVDYSVKRAKRTEIYCVMGIRGLIPGKDV
jgi:hypothetical protein